jgi:signal transduction histidine kinase/PAS domain-containing protein
VYDIYYEQRKTGVELVDEVPWGTSFCQFFQTYQDQIDLLVPYFKAGLKNNESCLWVTSGLAEAKSARQALATACPDFARYLEKGQIDIVPASRWYVRGKSSSTAMVSRLDCAISGGFDGLRLAISSFPRNNGKPAAAPELEADDISRYNVIALYSYPRDEFDAAGVMEVVKNHRFALVYNTSKWEVIESSAARVASDALKRSEEKLTYLFSNMAEGFAYHRIILNAQGKPCDYVFLEINDAFEKFLSLKSKDIIGKRVTEVLPGIEKDPVDWIGRYGRVALTGEPAHFESYSAVLKRWYSVSAFSPHRGFFGVTFTDITERKQADAELQVNNERLRILSESSSLLLSSNSPETIVQTIAERVMAHLSCDCFFNYIADNKTGKLRLNAYAGIPDDAAKGISWLEYGSAICGCAARDGCRIVSEDVQQNGDMRATLVRSFGIQAYACHPLQIGMEIIGTLSFGTRTRTKFDEDELDLMKTVAGQVSVAMERQRTEEALKQRTLELEASNKELESFSYTVSHDLRAPLRTMDGFSQAVLEDYADKLDEDGKKWLRGIRGASQRMAQLIDDILGLSRVVRAGLRLQKINLSEIAKSAAAELQASQPERRVEFRIAEGLEAHGDPNLLRVALNNLLGNAFKFTSRCPQAVIEFGSIERDGERYYFVKDNGAGFDMTYSDKLFKAFQRLHAASEFPGTGIGLATVQRIVQRHGGSVYAEGKPGQGAAFYFSLG